MSVVGFDLGYQNCFISVARQGGIEVVTNDYSLHATPSCVQFGPKSRVMGVAAKQAMLTNLKNTVTSFKNLVGRKFSDPVVQREIKWIPCRVVPLPDDYIGIQVNYLGETRNFLPEQIVSILLLKLKETAESYLKSKVSDCVISIPCFWTDAQRRALLDASKIADLNCLRILNETTATALAYGIYKQDLPTEEEKPRNVVFVDVGTSATQACLVAFNKGKLRVLGTSWEMELGGRDFNSRLRDHFRKEFQDKYRIDAGSQPRAWNRLLDECEKLKKLMSANTSPIPLNIECLMEDKDVTGTMKRKDFENMCCDLFAKLESLLKRLLTETKTTPADIDSVELIGGGSRMPKVKEIVHNIFKQDPKTTLNQDEAVSRGCALQCASLSPTFRVREFNVTDAQPYAIKLMWPDDGEAVVFDENHAFPFSKMVTLYRKDPFTLEASYNYPNRIPYPSIKIGQFAVKNVVPSPDQETQKVKVKVRLNANGIFCIASASMYEKQIQTETDELPESTGLKNEDTMETEQNEESGDQEMNGPVRNGPDQPPQAGRKPGEGGQRESGESKGPEVQPAAPTPPKPVKSKIKSQDLPIEEIVPQLSPSEMERFRAVEADMYRNDRVERERAFAKNALEEYIYDTRDKLSDSLASYITEKDSETFRGILQETEDWLYDEGEEQEKKVYEDRLERMRKLGDPVVERYQEAQERPAAFDLLAKTLQQTRKAYGLFVSGDERYNHIDAADMEKVRKIVEDKQGWFDRSYGVQANRPLTEPPVVMVNQIYNELEALERVAHPILNKPKPKVEPPKEDDKGKPQQNGAPPEDATQKGAENKMEVD